MTMPFSPCPSSGPCSDVSVGMLRSVFGPIIDVLVSGADPNTVSAASSLLGTLFMTFNSGVLIIGSIIVSYVAMMGAVNTANDGEAMGKAWSSVWTPVRIVAGGAVLLPSASGYSFIQMLVLMISLWSAGFASSMYRAGITLGVLKPDGIVASSTAAPGSAFGLRAFAKQYLPVAYCARAANTIYADPAGNPSVMANNSQADRITAVDGRTDYTFFIKDRNAATNLGGGEPICGTVKVTTYTPTAATEATGTSIAIATLHSGLSTSKAAAATALMQNIDAWVATMPSDMNQPGWDSVQSAQFNAIVKAREDALISEITAQASSSQSAIDNGISAFVTGMTDEGWASAGGWYQRVGAIRKQLAGTVTEPAGSATEPSLSGLPADARAHLLKGSVTTMAEAIIKKSEEPGKGYDPTAAPAADFASALPKDGTSDINVGAIREDLGSKFGSFVNTTMNGVVNIATGASPGVDAVSRMKLVGDYLVLAMASAELAKVALETSVTALRVVVGAVGGVEVLGNKADFRGVTDPLWDWTMAVPVDQLTQLVSYLKPLAFYFSVFLPSLPYTIFMIVVVGWLLGVLQTVVAAPLWAIMHMRPSQTFVGSESQGYLLLMALFVRPALAVIGLFAAMLVADPVVDFIAKAFFSMRGAVVTSTGLFPGALVEFFTFAWWLFAFGLVLLPVLYMIFGLPHVLPDHVLKWLNVGVSDLGATHAMSNIRGGLAMAALQGGGMSPKILPRGGSPAGGVPRPSALPGGSAGSAIRTNRSASYSSSPINVGHQGIAPLASDSPAAQGSSGSTRSNAMGTGSEGADATAQHRPNLVSTAAAHPPSAASNRTGSKRLSDAAGVALGHAVIGAVGTARASAARLTKGDVLGAVAAASSGTAETSATVAREGIAAWREGADARIASLIAERNGTSATGGVTTRQGAPVTAMASDAPADNRESGMGVGAESPTSTTPPEDHHE